MTEKFTKKPIKFIRKRCPHLKGKELLEAEERFREHLRICLEIYHRLEKGEEKRKTSFDKNRDGTYNENNN